MIKCPGLLSVTRKPTSSRYLATGLEVLVAVKCAGIAGAALACLSGAEEEEEQPLRNTARKNAAGKSQPSRIETIIATLVCVALPKCSPARSHQRVIPEHARLEPAPDPANHGST